MSMAEGATLTGAGRVIIRHLCASGVAFASQAPRSQHVRRRRSSMATGTVKWFSDAKGFGFITPDDQSSDLFVHHSAIVGTGYRSVNDGAKVTYDAEPGDAGPKAANVQLA